MLRVLAFIAVLAAVGVPVAGLAYDPTPPAQEVLSPPTVHGVIDQIDFKTGRVVVITESEEFVFQASLSTVVTINGYAASFKDLRLGYEVKVQYDSTTREAFRIDAQR